MDSEGTGSRVMPKMTSVGEFFQEFSDHPENEESLMTQAVDDLSGKDLADLKRRIEGKKKKMKKDEEKNKSQNTPESSTTGGVAPVVNARDFNAEMKLVEAFWVELEAMDPTSLLSDDVMDAFKYIGFDPDVVLREFLQRGQTAKKSSAMIKKDMVDIVTIAIIKGSVTMKNLQKTSDTGKVLYKALQDSYQLATGGAKGKDSTHLTVARVAAAVPGIVIQVLVKRPEFAKAFVGPFSSKSLPPYLRHQAAAACIPEKTSEKLREFLLGLITAFTADQTKTLSKSKDSSEELFDTQLNYVNTTYSGKHPSEVNRQKIFRNFSLSSDYEKLAVVAAKIKKVKSDFVVLTQQELDDELAK